MKGSFEAELRVERPDPDRLEAALDQVMEELLRLGVEDPAIGGALADGEVEVTMTVHGASVEEVLSKAMGTFRAALHAAGFSTPGWPQLQPAPDSLQADWEKLTLVPA